MEKKAATINEFSGKSLLGVQVDDVPVLLVRGDDGNVYALEDRCSHEDFKLSPGTLEDGQIVCPKHGARFCPRTGAALSMPAFVPVRTFSCRIEAGDIFVEIPE